MYIGLVESGYAETTNKQFEKKYLKDINGEPLVTGNPYLVSLKATPKLGLTYEKYLNNDYVLQTLPTEENKQVGVPIVIWKQEEEGTKDQVIFDEDWLWFEIHNANYQSHRYWNFPKERGYVKLDEHPSILSIKDYGKDDYVFRTGGESKVCVDKIGRPADCFMAEYSYTADSIFYLLPAGGIDENKNWLTIFPEFHKKPWDLNYKEFQPFVFIPI
ncbi:hypothetical protein bthur0001_54960 [Bacillus thuringiensis serovar tochigiensis BGSC 4Y1]|nr:hypothetical protein bthur0001_54960 [Bacillus thuringiensis serovar tochigiensis BGSC 4Y1]